MAGIIKRLWKEYGFEVELPTYEVLLSYPKKNARNKVQVINGTGHSIYEVSWFRNNPFGGCCSKHDYLNRDPSSLFINLSRLQTSKFSMTSFYMANKICQVHVCMCDKFYMTSFWFSDRHDSYYFSLQQ